MKKVMPFEIHRDGYIKINLFCTQSSFHPFARCIIIILVLIGDYWTRNKRIRLVCKQKCRYTCMVFIESRVEISLSNFK
jgi:hypothetical protein